MALSLLMMPSPYARQDNKSQPYFPLPAIVDVRKRRYVQNPKKTHSPPRISRRPEMYVTASVSTGCNAHKVATKTAGRHRHSFSGIAATACDWVPGRELVSRRAIRKTKHAASQ